MYLKNLSNLTKINWLVRVKNPVWWIQIIVAFILPILGYFGITGEDLTTWPAIFELIKSAISNPYVIFIALCGALNASLDPTTSGVTDSTNALTYETPNKD